METKRGCRHIRMCRNVVISISVLVLGSTLFSQQVPNRVGAISLQKALAGTHEGQKAAQNMTSKVEPKQKEFSGRQQEIAQLEEQLSKGVNLLNEERKAQLARDIDLKKKRLERDTQDAEESLRKEQQDVLQSLSQRLLAVLSKYAKNNGYSLVVEAGDPNSSVLFSAPETDITEAVIALYDKTYDSGTTPKSHP